MPHGISVANASPSPFFLSLQFARRQKKYLSPFSFAPLRASPRPEITFVLSVRRDDSKLMIGSLAPEPPAPHTGTSSQKRGLGHAIEGGLYPSEHVDLSLASEPPPSARARLLFDAGKAISFFLDTPPDEIRSFGSPTSSNSRERAADLEAEQRLALRGVKPHCKPFASKVFLSPEGRAIRSWNGRGRSGGPV